MKTTCNEVCVNTGRQKALINHFIRELFGNEGVRADVQKYSPEEYARVLQEFTAYNCSSLPDSVGNAAHTPLQDMEVLLSFLKLYALKALGNSEAVSIKDHLANHLALTAMLKVAGLPTPEQFFRDDLN